MTEGKDNLYRVVGKIPGAVVPLSGGSMTKSEAQKRADIEKAANQGAGIGKMKVKVVPDPKPAKWKTNA